MTIPLNAPVELCSDALEAYFRKHMSELKDVIQDFPTPNIPLVFPSLAITNSADDGCYSSLSPYETEEPEPTELLSQTSVFVVGHWDFKMYLDFWCSSQPDRNKIFAKANELLNPDVETMGLRLQLPNYHDAWASFDVSGIRHEDKEVSAQTGEWRVTITLLVHAPHLREAKEFLIKTVELTQIIVDNESIPL